MIPRKLFLKAILIVAILVIAGTLLARERHMVSSLLDEDDCMTKGGRWSGALARCTLPGDTLTIRAPAAPAPVAQSPSAHE